MSVYCKEAPGSVVFTGPATEDEGDLDSLPEKIDFGHRSFTENTTANSRTDTGSAEIALANWLHRYPL